MKAVSILIPTYNRVDALIATLTSVSVQNYRDFDVVIADQSDSAVIDNKTLQAIFRLLEHHGCQVSVFKNLPRNGLAQQRHFLLSKSSSPLSLFLDDDLLLEPFVLTNMVKTIEKERCGFVGCAPIGLSFKDDLRPEEEHIDLWEEKVKPEKIEKNSNGWNRYQLHNAANLLHVEQKLQVDSLHPMLYKVAWVGGCVLYDTKKLKKSGEFSFWNYLPNEHAGEDVLVQLRVMEQYGGCGIIPSGVYHQELPTTISDRRINAIDYLYSTG